MKKLILLLIAGLLMVPALNGFAQKPPKPDIKKKITIPGTEDWVNTGIKVLPKDKIVITVEGEVCFSGNYPEACVDPDGWGRETYFDDWPGDYTECDDPMMQYNHCTVLGNVGNDDFLVGKEITVTGKEGILYLGINDCTFTQPEELQNTGEFVALIKVYKKKK